MQVLFKLLPIASQGDLGLVGKTDCVAWFQQAYLWRLDRQLGKDTIVDLVRLPSGEESVTLLKVVSEFLKARGATADS
jgi:hypothetical protein